MLFSTTPSVFAAGSVYYEESQEDIRVKVLGGLVMVKRTFADGKWHFNHDWASLKLVRDPVDDSVKGIARGKAEYKRTASSAFSYGTRHTIRQTTSGFRWVDRNGDWIEFDKDGFVSARGDRNDIKVTFLHETSNGTKRLTGIKDHFGRQVLWFEYTDQKPKAIRDHTNRRVTYFYTGDNLTSVIDVNGHTWKYGYTDGVPTTFTDPENRTTTRTWANNGELASIQYADGVRIDYGYDFDSSKELFYRKGRSSGGQIIEMWSNRKGDVVRLDLNGKTKRTLSVDTETRTRTTTDERGLKQVVTLDEWDNVRKRVHSSGALFTRSYDPVYSKPIRDVDERGVVTDYEYDGKGNLKKQTEGVGKSEQRITEFTYDSLARLRTRTIKGGTITLPGGAGTVTTPDAVTEFEYDDYGNITAMIDPENHRTEWTDHDAVGNPRSLKDARGYLWARTYDNRGMLLTEKDPLARVKKREYDKAGWHSKTIDVVGNTTTFTYNPRHQIRSISDAYSGVFRFEYDTHDQLVGQIDAEGRKETLEYNADGEIVKRIDGNGNIVQFIYGDEASGLNGLMTKAVYPTFTREFKYNLVGLVVEEIDILDATTRRSIKRSYDEWGTLIREVDPENKTLTYEYDAFHRVKRLQDALSTIEFFYDQRDNIIAFKDGNGKVYRFEYDRRSKLIQSSTPMGQTSFFSYDPRGLIRSVTNPKAQQVRFAFDEVGRKTKEEYFLSVTADSPVKTITFGYTDLDDLTTWSDGVVSGSVDYDDKQQRRLGERINYGGFTLGYRYEYLANGLKKSFTGPDGIPVHYAYDDNNQLRNVTLPVGSLTVNQYKWMGPERITYPGGSTRSQKFDALMRLTGVSVKSPAQSEVMSHRYGYDKTNRLIEKITELGAHAYSYDEAHRLRDVTGSGQLPSEAYTYDATSNRKTSHNVAGEWQYNANNQLEAFGNTTFQYDEHGNTVRRVENGQHTQYIYDFLDRLAEVKDANENTVAKYYYDFLGRRLWKEVDNNRTYFLHSDSGLIAEADHTGTVTKSYGYVPQGPWGTDPIYLKEGSNYYFFQNDRIGTTQKLIDIAGNVVWSARSEAYGRTVVEAGATVTNNLRFPGQYFDSETGLHYNFKRYYDPSTGRYLTTDPIGFEGGLNLYAYVVGDPVNIVDPTGEIPVAPLVIPAGRAILAAGLIGGGSSAIGTYMNTGDWKKATVSGIISGVISAGSIYVAARIVLPSRMIWNQRTLNPENGLPTKYGFRFWTANAITSGGGVLSSAANQKILNGVVDWCTALAAGANSFFWTGVGGFGLGKLQGDATKPTLVFGAKSESNWMRTHGLTTFGRPITLDDCIELLCK